MIEIRTYQSDRSVACHAVGVVRQVKLDWSTGLPDREDMTSSETWLEAYGRRHAGTYPGGGAPRRRQALRQEL